MKRILIVAGIHGDEPSGPEVALVFQGCQRTLKEDFGLELDIIPLVNFFGFQERIRWNANGEDLDRNFFSESSEGEPTECRALKAFFDSTDYTYDLFVSLHEDPERTEFYLYDAGTGAGRTTPIVKAIRKVVKKFGVKFYTGVDDPDDPKLGYHIENGYHGERLAEVLKSESIGSLEDYLLRMKKAKRSVTLELPGQLELSRKIELGIAIVDMILDEIAKM